MKMRCYAILLFAILFFEVFPEIAAKRSLSQVQNTTKNLDAAAPNGASNTISKTPSSLGSGVGGVISPLPSDKISAVRGKSKNLVSQVSNRTDEPLSQVSGTTNNLGDISNITNDPSSGVSGTVQNFNGKISNVTNVQSSQGPDAGRNLTAQVANTTNDHQQPHVHSAGKNFHRKLSNAAHDFGTTKKHYGMRNDPRPHLTSTGSIFRGMTNDKRTHAIGARNVFYGRDSRMTNDQLPHTTGTWYNTAGQYANTQNDHYSQVPATGMKLNRWDSAVTDNPFREVFGAAENYDGMTNNPSSELFGIDKNFNRDVSSMTNDQRSQLSSTRGISRGKESTMTNDEQLTQVTGERNIFYGQDSSMANDQLQHATSTRYGTAGQFANTQNDHYSQAAATGMKLNRWDSAVTDDPLRKVFGAAENYDGMPNNPSSELFGIDKNFNSDVSSMTNDQRSQLTSTRGISRGKESRMANDEQLTQVTGERNIFYGQDSSMANDQLQHATSTRYGTAGQFANAQNDHYPQAAATGMKLNRWDSAVTDDPLRKVFGAAENYDGMPNNPSSELFGIDKNFNSDVSSMTNDQRSQLTSTRGISRGKESRMANDEQLTQVTGERNIFYGQDSSMANDQLQHATSTRYGTAGQFANAQNDHYPQAAATGMKLNRWDSAVTDDPLRKVFGAAENYDGMPNNPSSELFGIDKNFNSDVSSMTNDQRSQLTSTRGISRGKESRMANDEQLTQVTGERNIFYGQDSSMANDQLQHATSTRYGTAGQFANAQNDHYPQAAATGMKLNRWDSAVTDDPLREVFGAAENYDGMTNNPSSELFGIDKNFNRDVSSITNDQRSQLSSTRGISRGKESRMANDEQLTQVTGERNIFYGQDSSMANDQLQHATSTRYGTAGQFANAQNDHYSQAAATGMKLNRWDSAVTDDPLRKVFGAAENYDGMTNNPSSELFGIDKNFNRDVSSMTNDQRSQLSSTRGISRGKESRMTNDQQLTQVTGERNIFYGQDSSMANDQLQHATSTRYGTAGQFANTQNNHYSQAAATGMNRWDSAVTDDPLRKVFVAAENYDGMTNNPSSELFGIDKNFNRDVSSMTNDQRSQLTSTRGISRGEESRMANDEQLTQVTGEINIFYEQDSSMANDQLQHATSTRYGTAGQFANAQNDHYPQAAATGMKLNRWDSAVTDDPLRKVFGAAENYDGMTNNPSSELFGIDKNFNRDVSSMTNDQRSQLSSTRGISRGKESRMTNDEQLTQVTGERNIFYGQDSNMANDQLQHATSTRYGTAGQFANAQNDHYSQAAATGMKLNRWDSAVTDDPLRKVFGAAENYDGMTNNPSSELFGIDKNFNRDVSSMTNDQRSQLSSTRGISRGKESRMTNDQQLTQVTGERNIFYGQDSSMANDQLQHATSTRYGTAGQFANTQNNHYSQAAATGMNRWDSAVTDDPLRKVFGAAENYDGMPNNPSSELFGIDKNFNSDVSSMTNDQRSQLTSTRGISRGEESRMANDEQLTQVTGERNIFYGQDSSMANDQLQHATSTRYGTAGQFANAQNDHYSQAAATGMKLNRWDSAVTDDPLRKVFGAAENYDGMTNNPSSELFGIDKNFNRDVSSMTNDQRSQLSSTRGISRGKESRMTNDQQLTQVTGERNIYYGQDSSMANDQLQHATSTRYGTAGQFANTQNDHYSQAAATGMKLNRWDSAVTDDPLRKVFGEAENYDGMTNNPSSELFGVDKNFNRDVSSMTNDQRSQLTSTRGISRGEESRMANDEQLTQVTGEINIFYGQDSSMANDQLQHATSTRYGTAGQFANAQNDHYPQAAATGMKLNRWDSAVTDDPLRKVFGAAENYDGMTNNPSSELFGIDKNFNRDVSSMTNDQRSQLSSTRGISRGKESRMTNDEQLTQVTGERNIFYGQDSSMANDQLQHATSTRYGTAGQFANTQNDHYSQAAATGMKLNRWDSAVTDDPLRKVFGAAENYDGMPNNPSSELFGIDKNFNSDVSSMTNDQRSQLTSTRGISRGEESRMANDEQLTQVTGERNIFYGQDSSMANDQLQHATSTRYGTAGQFANAQNDHYSQAAATGMKLNRWDSAVTDDPLRKVFGAAENYDGMTNNPSSELFGIDKNFNRDVSSMTNDQRSQLSSTRGISRGKESRMTNDQQLTQVTGERNIYYGQDSSMANDQLQHATSTRYGTAGQFANTQNDHYSQAAATGMKLNRWDSAVTDDPLRKVFGEAENYDGMTNNPSSELFGVDKNFNRDVSSMTNDQRSQLTSTRGISRGEESRMANDEQLTQVTGERNIFYGQDSSMANDQLQHATSTRYGTAGQFANAQNDHYPQAAATGMKLNRWDSAVTDDPLRKVFVAAENYDGMTSNTSSQLFGIDKNFNRDVSGMTNDQRSQLRDTGKNRDRQVSTVANDPRWQLFGTGNSYYGITNDHLSQLTNARNSFYVQDSSKTNNQRSQVSSTGQKFVGQVTSTTSDQHDPVYVPVPGTTKSSDREVSGVTSYPHWQESDTEKNFYGMRNDQTSYTASRGQILYGQDSSTAKDEIFRIPSKLLKEVSGMTNEPPSHPSNTTNTTKDLGGKVPNMRNDPSSQVSDTAKNSDGQVSSMTTALSHVPSSTNDTVISTSSLSNLGEELVAQKNGGATSLGSWKWSSLSSKEC